MRANHALAVHQHLKASEAWAKKETSKTGHELKAAASHLERALAWSGHEIEAAIVNVMETGRDVGEKLIQGGRWTAEDVGKALKDLGEKLKDWLRTKKKILKAVSLSVGLCSYGLWGGGLRLDKVETQGGNRRFRLHLA